MVYNGTQIEAAEPPEFLFKAVDEESADGVFRHGLKRNTGSFVTMYTSKSLAKNEISVRFPFFYVIMAGLMSEDGYKFYDVGDGKWLAEEVPAKYLRFS